MATPGNERELLTKGLEQDGVVRGVWAQNLWLAQGSISVRPGWGVRAELDTTLGNSVTYVSAGTNNFTSINFGYQKHLGSSYIETNFGNKQVVSVFLFRGQSGSLGADQRVGLVNVYYVVRIFDLTTGRSWEEILVNKTSTFGSKSSLIDQITESGSFPSQWYGSYETAFDVDNESIVSASSQANWFFFSLRGLLYFGSPSAGIFLYRPADFHTKRHMQMQTDSLFRFASGHSESALVERISFSDGIFSDGFVYVSESQISKIVAATSFRGRIAYATEYEIFFSDPGRPNNIISTNFINVPSSNKVTAMHEFKGNLVIFTSDEMYLYVPSEGTIISQGRPPINVSESVGCIGQQAITMMEDDLTWVARSGVFSTSTGTSIRELSEPIRAFFGGHGIMTNPMTSYYEANNGWVNINNVNPPRTLLEFDSDRVTLAYNHKKRTLLMGCPGVNGGWAFSGIWSWWPMESSVGVDAALNPTVTSSANLVDPWIMGTTEDFYCVCGVNTDFITDNSYTVVTNVPNAYPPAGISLLPDTAKAKNFILCELGYGGALDRSTYKEDYRLGSGKYVPAIPFDKGLLNGCYYFDEPYKEEDYVTGNTYYYLPISAVPPRFSVVPFTRFQLRFRFDKNEWNPEQDGSNNVNVRWPTERLVSGPAIFASGAGFAKRTDASGTADPAGEYISIDIDGNAAVATGWSFDPAFNLGRNVKNPVIEIRFSKATANSVTGMGIYPVLSEITIATQVGPVAKPAAALVWTKSFIGSADSHNDNAKVQVVDWAYKSNEAEVGPQQIKARGIYAKLNSKGNGVQANKVVPNWLWGLYNVILGSDSKEFTSQIVDYDENIQRIVNKNSLRSRFRNSSGAMSQRIFSGEAKWGSDADSAHGNFLIDDQQTDMIATSDSVKGQRISYMVFGFIQDKAQSLTLQSLMGVFRRAGGRRRTGR